MRYTRNHAALGPGILYVLTLAACGLEEGELTEAEGYILGGDASSLSEFPATGFVAHHPSLPPEGRGCTAIRIAPNAILTAAHCVTDPDPGHYRFGQGDDTRKHVRYQDVIEIDLLSPNFDLALLRTTTCKSSFARIASPHGFDDHYTLSTFLHENNTRDGRARKISSVLLQPVSSTRVRSTIMCAQASVWGGDSGSPLYDTDPDVDRAEQHVVGIATSVGGFCQNGAQTQTIYYWRVDGAAGIRIQSTLDAWAQGRPCLTQDAALNAD